MDMDLGDLEPRSERERFIWDDGYRHAEEELRPQIENLTEYVRSLERLLRKLCPSFQTFFIE